MKKKKNKKQTLLIFRNNNFDFKQNCKKWAAFHLISSDGPSSARDVNKIVRLLRKNFVLWIRVIVSFSKNKHCLVSFKMRSLQWKTRIFFCAFYNVLNLFQITEKVEREKKTMPFVVCLPSHMHILQPESVIGLSLLKTNLKRETTNSLKFPIFHICYISHFALLSRWKFIEILLRKKKKCV